MHRAIFSREAGGLSFPGRPRDQIWGGFGPAGEGLVRKLALEHSLEHEASTAINDLCWDDSGAFLASAGDECALHIYSVSGRRLRSIDPVRLGCFF